MAGPTSIEPGVGAVILDGQGRVLLHRRPEDGHLWAPPSGTMEPGEAVLDCLLREVREETGLDVEVDGLVGLYSDPSFQTVEIPGQGRVQFVTAVFLCRAAGGELRGSDEGSEWRFFPRDALPEDQLPYSRVWLADAFAAPRPFVR
ncbi:MAG TPA: NUDIX domain-containing protein [Dehalococcoidia bacterium]